MSETETAVDAEGDAAFGAGFEGKDVAPVDKKPDPAPSSTGEKVEEKPEYVTKAELEEIRKAIEDASKISSKAFGTAGKAQQLVNELRSQAEGKQVTTSAEALGKLKGQFPELGEAIEAVLSGQPKTPTVDDETLDRKFQERLVAREMAHLQDSYPDWMTIVGAPPTAGEKPVDTPFRQWLAGKDEAYRKWISDSDFPADIERAIRRFQRETKAQAKPTPTRDTQTGRFRDAVQQRGDGAPPTATNDLDAAFESGFRGR